MTRASGFALVGSDRCLSCDVRARAASRRPGMARLRSTSAGGFHLAPATSSPRASRSRCAHHPWSTISTSGRSRSPSPAPARRTSVCSGMTVIPASVPSTGAGTPPTVRCLRARSLRCPARQPIRTRVITPGNRSRGYRLGVHRAGDGMWRGEVTDLTTGEAVTVRDLFAASPLLGDPMVWSEVFARCDDPSVTAAGRTSRSGPKPATASLPPHSRSTTSPTPTADARTRSQCRTTRAAWCKSRTPKGTRRRVGRSRVLAHADKAARVARARRLHAPRARCACIGGREPARRGQQGCRGQRARRHDVHGPLRLHRRRPGR